jgi:lauroyl/myristoyl acyltransferase
MPLIHLFDLYLLGVLALVHLSASLKSHRLHQVLVRLVSGTAYRISNQKRAKIRAGLGRAYNKSLSTSQLESIAESSFAAFWDEVFAMAYNPHFLPTIESKIQGIEHLRAALANGRGAILLESNCFGKRHLGKFILRSNNFAVSQVHARMHVGSMGGGNQGPSRLLLNYLIPYADRRERLAVSEVIYLDENGGLGVTRELDHRLEQNGIVCIAIEGRMGHKRVTLPYLGTTHSFATGIVSLAKLSGASLLPISCVPNEAGKIALEIGDPAELPLALGREDTMTQVLKTQVEQFEKRICEHPEWYWGWNLLDTSSLTPPPATDSR